MAACSCPRQASLDPAAAQLPAGQASASIWTCLHQHKPAPVGLCRPDLAPEQLTGSYIVPTALLQVLGLFHSALQCQGVLVPDEHHPGRFEILFTEPRPGSRWGLLHLAASQFCSSPMVPACLSATDKPIYLPVHARDHDEICPLLQKIVLPTPHMHMLAHKAGPCCPCRESPADTQRQAPASLGMQN